MATNENKLGFFIRIENSTITSIVSDAISSVSKKGIGWNMNPLLGTQSEILKDLISAATAQILFLY